MPAISPETSQELCVTADGANGKLTQMMFEGYKLVVFAVVCIEVALVVLSFRKNPLLALRVTILSLMLKGQFIWVGNPLYAWQVSGLLGLIFFASIGPNLRLPSQAGISRGLSWAKVSITIYAIVTILNSVLQWFALAVTPQIGTLANIALDRVFTQTLYFLLTIGLFVFGVVLGRFIRIHELLRAIVVIATITAYFAIIQAVLFYTTGLNLFPIIRGDGSLESAFIQNLTFRASSFAGEPKHLGLMVALGLVCLWILRMARLPTGRYWLHQPIALVTAAILSLSATGLYITAASIGFLAVFFIRRVRLAEIFIVSVLVVIAGIYYSGSGDDFASTLVKQASKGSFEVQDVSVIAALINEPTIALTGTGLGNIHLYAVDYLPEDFPKFRDQGYKANSGLFYIAGDAGLIGLLLFLLPHIQIVSAARSLKHSLAVVEQRQLIAIMALLLGSLISFLLRFNELHFLVIGIAYSGVAYFDCRRKHDPAEAKHVETGKLDAKSPRSTMGQSAHFMHRS